MKKIPREYTLLFNAITDVDRALLHLHETLMLAQQSAEELIMEAGPEETQE